MFVHRWGMARKRKKVLGQKAYYHLMSRTVNGEALFGRVEREVFRKMIWQVADFSGVRVITYAVMKNHFHILAEVPSGDVSVSDEEIVRRYKRLYPRPTPWQPMPAEVLRGHLRDNSEEGQRLRAQLLRRMHDVSEMMKTLKLRFSIWFNRSSGRFGTLWSERFKSVLIEGSRFALRTVAAYIDLNAVRAGIVSDPKDYRFCGYGEAVSGKRIAREGISAVSGDLSGYRELLYGAGSVEKDGKSSILRDQAVKVLTREKGKIPLAALLRCRVRYFSDGVILGSEKFVREQLRKDPPGKRPKVPREMRGTDWNGLMVGSSLKSRLFE